MPVVVTGAGGFVGAALLPRLVRTGGEVRALVRTTAQRARVAEVLPKVAAADLEDVETLRVLFHDAHTVIHLAGGVHLPDDAAYERVNAATTESVVEAAAEAGVRRLILLSAAGAARASANAYLRAKARAEEAVVSGGVPEPVVIRSVHAYGPGGAWFQAMRSLARLPVAVVPGRGDQELAPVFVHDLASVVAAADDRDTTVAGTFAVEGPDVLTADELVARLSGRRRRVAHVAPERAAALARLARTSLSPTFADLLARQSRADAPDAAVELGVERTSLDEGLSRSVR